METTPEEHDRTREALRGALPRLAELVAAVPDPAAPSGIPPWTVGDTAAHLCAVHRAFGAAAAGRPTPLSAGLPAPRAGAGFPERMAAVNAAVLDAADEAARSRPAEVLAEAGAAFLDETSGLPPDSPVRTPWYGPDTVLDLATATGLVLNETLLHGLDIARGAGLAWRIGEDEARAAVARVMPAMMPRSLDAVRARGVRVAFDVALRGGPRLAVSVAEGSAAVSLVRSAEDVPERGFDCRLAAAPVAFLLVAFERTPLVREVVLGRMRPGGRRPWLATRLGSLFDAP